MDKSRTRHGSWLALFLLLAPVVSGCEIPQTGSVSVGAPTSSSNEAERTKKIEAKAAEIERMAQDIQNMTGTEQEKIDAMNKLEQARRELNELQESP